MFKNLNQLKNKIEEGQKVKVKNYLKDTEENRIVIKKQTNGIYTGVEISKKEYEEKRKNWITGNNVTKINGRYFTKTLLHYQKSSQMKFTGETVEFLTFDKESYGGVIRSPSLDFKVGEPWLELVF